MFKRAKEKPRRFSARFSRDLGFVVRRSFKEQRKGRGLEISWKRRWKGSLRRFHLLKVRTVCEFVWLPPQREKMEISVGIEERVWSSLWKKVSDFTGKVVKK